MAQYEGLYRTGRVKHVCCWAHARRKFVAASEAGDERADKALELIGRLYAIERALPPLLTPSDDPVTTNSVGCAKSNVARFGNATQPAC